MPSPTPMPKHSFGSDASSRAHRGDYLFRVATMMLEATADVRACTEFSPGVLPRHIGRRIWSNNLVERLNKEIKRGADVVDI